MSKQLKRINGFSILKEDAGLMLDFAHAVGIKKEVTKKYNKLRPYILKFFKIYNTTVFSLFWNDNSIKQIELTDRNNPSCDYDLLKKKYPKAYKECVKYSKVPVIRVS